MKTTLTLTSETLKATELFTSKDATRYVLNGICLEIPDARTAIFAATDGRRLFAVRLPDPDISGWERPLKIIIPTTITKPIRARDKKAGRFITITIEEHQRDSASSQTGKVEGVAGEATGAQAEKNPPIGLPGNKDPKPSHRITITDFVSGIAYSSHEIEGNFPNWRMVTIDAALVPATNPCINPELLADFPKAAKILGEKNLGIRFLHEKPDCPLVVQCNNYGGYDVVPIIMPMRADMPLFQTCPAWSRPVKPTLADVVPTTQVQQPEQ